MTTKAQDTISDTNSLVKWTSAVIPKKGEETCGDSSLVREGEKKVLVAAVDGLGHGNKAAFASKKAIDILKVFTNESVLSLVNHCHKRLRGTRGVALSLALIDESKGVVSWIGIGNVDGILFRPDQNKRHENLVLRGGVVGYKLPSLQVSTLDISPGDTLIFTTDGVDTNYRDRLDIKQTPKEIAEYITNGYVDGSDDALILVVRYLGT